MDLLDVAKTVIKGRLQFEAAMMDQTGSLANLAHHYINNSESGDSYCMDLPNGCRAVIVVTPVGNVVVQEFSREASQVDCHAPKILRGICGRGKLADDQLASIIGLWGQPNIGMVLNEVIRADQEFRASIGAGHGVRA